MRQLRQAGLQRVGVEVRGVQGARGQFGTVVQRKSPWEVWVEAPGVVERGVSGIRTQQGGRLGVTWSSCGRNRQTWKPVLMLKITCWRFSMEDTTDWKTVNSDVYTKISKKENHKLKRQLHREIK